MFGKREKTSKPILWIVGSNFIFAHVFVYMSCSLKEERLVPGSNLFCIERGRHAHIYSELEVYIRCNSLHIESFVFSNS